MLHGIGIRGNEYEGRSIESWAAGRKKWKLSADKIWYIKLSKCHPDISLE